MQMQKKLIRTKLKSISVSNTFAYIITSNRTLTAMKSACVQVSDDTHKYLIYRAIDDIYIIDTDELVDSIPVSSCFTIDDIIYIPDYFSIIAYNMRENTVMLFSYRQTSEMNKALCRYIHKHSSPYIKKIVNDIVSEICNLYDVKKIKCLTYH